MNEFSDTQLEAYLDEGLTLEQSAQIEASLRAGDANANQMGERLMTLVGRRDAGIHSLGAVWREHRLSCPTRSQLGSYLLGILVPSHADYVRFHIEAIGCRPCIASLSDLREQQAAIQESEIASRRQKYFQSSAGYLKEL